MNDQMMPNQGYNDQYGNSGQNQKFQRNAQKKKSKTGIIIAIVLIVLALCCGGIGLLINLMLNVAKDAEPIDLKEFELSMQDLGYSDYMMNSSTYMTFHKEDYSTEITVQDAGNEDLAKVWALDYQELYGYEDAKAKTSVSGGNYERVTWETDDTYYLVYRVNNTIVWAYSSNKSDIDDLKAKLK